MSIEEEKWMETRSAVRNAIVEMKEAGDAIEITAQGVAEDIADIILDELSISLVEE